MADFPHKISGFDYQEHGCKLSHVLLENIRWHHACKCWNDVEITEITDRWKNNQQSEAVVIRLAASGNQHVVHVIRQGFAEMSIWYVTSDSQKPGERAETDMKTGINLHPYVNRTCVWHRTIARWCTTLGSLTLTETGSATAVITVPLIATRFRQTLMITEKETPAASTLMETVGATRRFCIFHFHLVFQSIHALIFVCTARPFLTSYETGQDQ